MWGSLISRFLLVQTKRIPLVFHEVCRDFSCFLMSFQVKDVRESFCGNRGINRSLNRSGKAGEAPSPKFEFEIRIHIELGSFGADGGNKS